MTRRALILASAVIAVTALIAVLVPFSRRSARLGSSRELIMLRARQAELHDSLNVILARDSLMHFVRNDSSGIAVALSEPLLASMIQEAARRYLDHVEIGFEDVEGHGGGKFEVGSPIGGLTVGDWKVNATVHEITGLLAARRPVVEVRGTNRVHLAIPVQIRKGLGTVTLAFAWNSRSVFNLLCRDFKTVQTIRGSILPQAHVVQGHMVLSASDRGIVADPDFPREKFPLSMQLAEGSWSKLRVALKEQDKFLKCGLMMNPDTVLARLRVMATEGLRFGLPRRAFRTIVLPATISQSVRILNSPVEISASPHQLRISPGLVWYSAEIDARRSAGPDWPPETR
ncbi:MAG: hypothetical protein ABIS67_00940 [Candidatus Eisenbacteria bacterium]